MTSSGGPGPRNGAKSRRFYRKKRKHLEGLGGRALSERDRRAILGR